MTTAERLRWARGLSGLSAHKLDRLAGLGDGHVSMIETGRRTPGAETNRALCRVLGLPERWLAAGEGPPPSPLAIAAAVAQAALAVATRPRERAGRA